MLTSRQNVWSNATISHALYFDEKTSFAGIIIGSILYGVVVVIFFQCMAALLDPVHRKGRTKWGLVSYTVVMFSLVTVLTAMFAHIQSISYIDNRDFPGIEGVVPPGPLGYKTTLFPSALGIIPNVTFNLSNWLADGLLLYRCYVIYNVNLWAIALPCLMYLSSLAMGIMLIYQNTNQGTFAINFGLPYFLISIALNILLTLMIVIRLALYTRNVRNGVGATGINKSCKVVITMLIESCSLYTVSSLLVVGPSNSGITGIFLPVLAQTQVIAPLLIIQRVANRSALTNNVTASGHISSSETGSRGRLIGGGSGYLMSSADRYGGNSDKIGVVVETTIVFHRDIDGV